MCQLLLSYTIRTYQKAWSSVYGCRIEIRAPIAACIESHRPNKNPTRREFYTAAGSIRSLLALWTSVQQKEKEKMKSSWNQQRPSSPSSSIHETLVMCNPNHRPKVLTVYCFKEDGKKANKAKNEKEKGIRRKQLGGVFTILSLSLKKKCAETILLSRSMRENDRTL